MARLWRNAADEFVTKPEGDIRAQQPHCERKFTIHLGIMAPTLENRSTYAVPLFFNFIFTYSLLVCGPGVGYDEPEPTGHPDCNATMYSVLKAS